MTRGVGRIVAEGVIVVAVLMPLHVLAEQRERWTALATALVLLIFFVPPAIAVARLQLRQGTLFAQALGCLGFGFLLGLVVGAVGGIEKLPIHQLTGEPLGMSLGLWVFVALAFALASGLAYGVILGLVHAARALVRAPSPEAIAVLFRDLPRSSLTVGVVLSLIPGLGHFALGRPGRGRPYLLATVASGLTGLVLLVVGIILLVEGGVPTLPLLVAGGVLLLVPALLAVISAIDLLVTRPA